MKTTLITAAVLTLFVIALNVTAFIIALLFSNWITATISFMGTVLALLFIVYKLIEKEL